MLSAAGIKTKPPNPCPLGMDFSLEPKFTEVRHGSAAYEACLGLRREVLRRPLGLDFTGEDIERERVDRHLAAFIGGEVVGCLVLTSRSGGEVKMRQVAVAPGLRGRGIGRSLVRFSEEFAARRGYRIMTLHAREAAVPFYERLGYEAVGEPFEEVSIPHRRMRRSLIGPHASSHADDVPAA